MGGLVLCGKRTQFDHLHEIGQPKQYTRAAQGVVHDTILREDCLTLLATSVLERVSNSVLQCASQDNIKEML
jgi:hypothetical protein